jgi:serine phosphatase RsbU (regulator of sigma subunit)
VTCIVGIFDNDTDCGQLVNCGHIPAIWLSDESSIEFLAQMMPLGVASPEKADGAPVKFSLKHGWLVFLTDGITETKLIDYTFNEAYFVELFDGFSGGGKTDNYFWIDVEYQEPHLIWTIVDNAPSSNPQN